MRKNILLPTIAILGGLAGFVLRKWQLSAGFEPDTGLAIPGAPSAIVLLIWSALIVGSFIALCWQNKERLSWDQAFDAKRNTLYLTAAILSAFLLLLSAGMEVINLSVVYHNSISADTWGGRVAAAALPPLRIFLCLLGLPCVLTWSRNLYHGLDKGKESLPLLELCLLFCVWLISDYQVRAADPVILDYLYEVFAIVFSLMGLYFIAGYSFQTGKPRRTAVFCLMGVYFSLVTLADHHSAADLLRYGFAVLFLTAHAALLLEQHPAGGTPAEVETEANDHA